jgi:hypothetical protein
MHHSTLLPKDWWDAAAEARAGNAARQDAATLRAEIDQLRRARRLERAELLAEVPPGRVGAVLHAMASSVPR